MNFIKRRIARVVLALGFLLIVSGCAPQNPATQTPPAPNSAQTQTLNITKTLADANNAAVKLTITLRDQGKISQPTTIIIENWCASVARMDDAVATVLGSSDPWQMQRGKILALVLGFQLPATSGIDPALLANLNTILTLIKQIQTQVTL